MTSHRVRTGTLGSNYTVIRGSHKGRLIKLIAVLGDIKSNPLIEGYLCNGWGAATSIRIKIRFSDIEV